MSGSGLANGCCCSSGSHCASTNCDYSSWSCASSRRRRRLTADDADNYEGSTAVRELRRSGKRQGKKEVDGSNLVDEAQLETDADYDEDTPASIALLDNDVDVSRLGKYYRRRMKGRRMSHQNMNNQQGGQLMCNNQTHAMVNCTNETVVHHVILWDANGTEYNETQTHHVVTCDYAFETSTTTSTSTTTMSTSTTTWDKSQLTCQCGPGWIRKRVHHDFHDLNISGISIERSFRHNNSDLAYPFFYPSSRTLRMAFNATDDHDEYWPEWSQHPDPTPKCGGRSKLCEECIHADDCAAFSDPNKGKPVCQDQVTGYILNKTNDEACDALSRCMCVNAAPPTG